MDAYHDGGSRPVAPGVARRRAMLATLGAACAGLVPQLAQAKSEGVTDAEIVIGQSCQLTGPLAA